MHKWAKQKGFTIVELLIVIVVIGILASITIVAYNGIQQRAKNAQTTQALNTWLKALNLYKIEKGSWPSGFACLGTGYKYNLSGLDSSGYGQCRQTGAAWGVTESTAFNTAMQPYVGNLLPTPAFVTTRNTDTEWLRGLTYVFGGGAGNVVYIQAVYAGVLSTCPNVAGATPIMSVWDSNTYCHYQIGLTTDT